jgi:two-component system response regulator LytT
LLRFDNAIKFLNDYKPVYDMVFMDIEMPFLDGISASRKLREIDPNIPLIIVSKTSQYAVKGYEVNALGYLLKPARYFDFRVLFDKAKHSIEMTKDTFFMINEEEAVVKLPASQVLYIEVRDHYLYYVTDSKSYISREKTLGEEEERLKEKGFARCSNSYLINLKYITGLGKNDVFIGKRSLPISRAKKKEFVDAFLKYDGEYL